MVDNVFQPLFINRNTTITRCGFDTTDQISYTFNTQGFRSHIDYNVIPEYAFFGSSTILGVGINYRDILVNQFNNAQNYGLAGEYMNIHSVINLENFVKSSLYRPSVQVIFFWIDRLGKESIPELYQRVAQLNIEKILHVSQGQKYPGIINLMPEVDYDVSNTQPGPKSHILWAKTIKLILKNDKQISSG